MRNLRLRGRSADRSDEGIPLDTQLRIRGQTRNIDQGFDLGNRMEILTSRPELLRLYSGPRTPSDGRVVNRDLRRIELKRGELLVWRDYPIGDVSYVDRHPRGACCVVDIMTTDVLQRA